MLNQPLDEEAGDNAQRAGRTQSSNPRRTENTTTTNPSEEATAGGHRSVAGSDNPSIAIAPEGDDSVAMGRNIQTENLETIRLTPQDQDAIERVRRIYCNAICNT